MSQTAAQVRSGAATLAIVCGAVALFIGPVAGFFLGFLAVLAGVVGFLRSVSPHVSGGLMSLSAIVLGLAAMVVKVLQGALELIV